MHGFGPQLKGRSDVVSSWGSLVSQACVVGAVQVESEVDLLSSSNMLAKQQLKID